MASVETTTIRVRRSTHKRLQEEAEQRGKSVTELLEEAVEMLEEESILLSAERAWARMAKMPTDEFSRDGTLAVEDEGRPEPDDG